MALKKVTGKSSISPIPVIGIKSNPESLREYSADEFCRVAECAYYKAEARGYEPGHEIQDWLEAEAEIAQQSPLK
jgi:hypothetical protein